MSSQIVRFLAFYSLCALAFQASVASAASINHGDRLGGGTLVDFLQITEESFTDPVPLYGSPFRSGNQLFFLPGAFTTTAAGGSSDTTSGRLTMNIRAPMGYYLQKISVAETFQYSFTGPGTTATSVQASGNMKISDLVPGLSSPSNPALAYTPSGNYAMPLDISGVFTAGASVDLTGLHVQEIAFDLGNLLESYSELATTSLLQKTSVGGLALTVLIPEPATILLLPCTLLLMRNRRMERRFSHK